MENCKIKKFYVLFVVVFLVRKKKNPKLHKTKINHVNSSSKLDLDNENEAENQCYKSTSYSSLIVLNRNNKIDNCKSSPPQAPAS